MTTPFTIHSGYPPMSSDFFHDPVPPSGIPLRIAEKPEKPAKGTTSKRPQSAGSRPSSAGPAGRGRVGKLKHAVAAAAVKPEEEDHFASMPR